MIMIMIIDQDYQGIPFTAVEKRVVGDSNLTLTHGAVEEYKSQPSSPVEKINNSPQIQPLGYLKIPDQDPCT
jgi:hypothetical protein